MTPPSGLGRLPPLILGDVFFGDTDDAATISGTEAAEFPAAYQVAHRPHGHVPSLGDLLDGERTLLGRLGFQQPQAIGKQGQGIVGCPNVPSLPRRGTPESMAGCHFPGYFGDLLAGRVYVCPNRPPRSDPYSPTDNDPPRQTVPRLPPRLFKSSDPLGLAASRSRSAGLIHYTLGEALWRKVDPEWLSPACRPPEQVVETPRRALSLLVLVGLQISRRDSDCSVNDASWSRFASPQNGATPF
jgi:hypothetical protein